VPISVPIFCKKLYKGVPEIFNKIKEVNTPSNGTKISMDGKGRAIDNILLKDYGGQSNTRMYIYKHIPTESAFARGLKALIL
jgi:hypothetical protein